MDPRALAIRSVDYCRHPDEAVIEPRITRQMFDGAGRLVASWDPRLWGMAPRPNLSTVYGLSGQPVLTDSVDAGWQLSVLNHTGLLHSFWDARGNQRQCEYDDQQRPVAVTEQSPGALPCVVDRFTYGGADAVDAERNHCGRLIRHDNPASSQIIKEYGLAGAVLVESISCLSELETPDWPLDPDARDEWLEDEAFTTRHSFHPTGEMECLTDAMGNVRTFGYEVSGKLSEAWLTLAREGKQPQRLVSHIRYNALDQIESETAGNGVVTRADYAADDGRLIRLVAAVGSQTPLQDLNYVYDAVGNIVELEDKSQPVSHFNNQRIDPINRYRYDSLYQLIEASGWEVANPSHGPALPGLLPTPLDPNQRRNYTQRFDYDAGGNLITRHHSGAPGFSMFTSARSNRSLAQRDDGSLPGEAEIDFSFDACGNQMELQRGQAMHWDARNQLSRVTLVKREAEPDDYEGYAYDRAGHRLRKMHVSQTSRQTLCEEVRYLHGLEIHRHASGEEYHVISVEAGRGGVKTLHWPAGAYANQSRYSHCDHLRSSTLELDATAGVITQERYYAFGGTACWAGKSALVAKYKTIRYSGKELDATGLYYHGFRYYSPWLLRWVSADPAGIVDGLNQFCFVRNNPIGRVDFDGKNSESAIPKIAHFFWVGKNLPEEHAHNVLMYKELNPDYEVNVWTTREKSIVDTFFNMEEGNDPSGRYLATRNARSVSIRRMDELFRDLGKNYDNAHKIAGIFNQELSGAYNNFAAASDIAELAIVHSYGGVYMDVDVAMKAPMKPLDAPHGFLAFHEGSQTANAVIAAQRSSSIGNKLLEALTENYTDELYRSTVWITKRSTVKGMFGRDRATRNLSGPGIYYSDTRGPMGEPDGYSVPTDDFYRREPRSTATGIQERSRDQVLFAGYRSGVNAGGQWTTVRPGRRASIA